MSQLVPGGMATRIAAWLALAAASAALLLSLSGGGPGAPATEPLTPGPVDSAPAPVETDPDDDAGRNVAALRDLLLEEVTERERLDAEVEALRAELRSRTPLPRDDAPLPAQVQAQPSPWFDAAALREAGLPADEIARLRERFESQELATLYLRDRATREGWLGTPRFADESRALAERARGLRTELGDERFDWYLFATGQMNRVSVGDVLSTAPASAAGIETGDLVIRYDDRGIFTPTDLRSATAEGRLGERVAVDLERRGERVRLWVPRGPLGVRLGARRERPRG